MGSGQEGSAQIETENKPQVSPSGVVIHNASSTPAKQRHDSNTVLLSSQDLKPVDYNTLNSPSPGQSTAKNGNEKKKKPTPCCSIA
jgi:hypothetical protein